MSVERYEGLESYIIPSGCPCDNACIANGDCPCNHRLALDALIDIDTILAETHYLINKKELNVVSNK